MADDVLKVLVVEDNALNQKVMGAFLDHLGHTHEIIGDGTAALEAIAQKTYDVALVDIQLPGTNGADLVAELRNGGTEIPRLVAVTAMAKSDGLAFYQGKGFDDYLPKPVSLATLTAALDWR